MVFIRAILGHEVEVVSSGVVRRPSVPVEQHARVRLDHPDAFVPRRRRPSGTRRQQPLQTHRIKIDVSQDGEDHALRSRGNEHLLGLDVPNRSAAGVVGQHFNVMFVCAKQCKRTIRASRPDLKEIAARLRYAPEAHTGSLGRDDGAGIQNEAQEAGFLIPKRRGRSEVCWGHTCAENAAERMTIYLALAPERNNDSFRHGSSPKWNLAGACGVGVLVIYSATDVLDSTTCSKSDR